MSWNHNVHYHSLATRAVPPGCQRALDVGCGQGLLARKLARLSRDVIAIDADPGCLARARISSGGQPNITFIEGDVMSASLPAGSFDFIVAVATLHHLPLRAALERFRDLLRPGGILVIIGLYKIAMPIDYAYSSAAMPISWVIRFLAGEEEVGAPLQVPCETLRVIRKESNSVLPGSALRRRLFFRYSLIWQRPTGNCRT